MQHFYGPAEDNSFNGRCLADGAVVHIVKIVAELHIVEGVWLLPDVASVALNGPRFCSAVIAGTAGPSGPADILVGPF